MHTHIEIRGYSFPLADIATLSINWDKESEIQSLLVELFDGQSFDFIEENVQSPHEGELYTAKRLYQKLVGF